MFRLQMFARSVLEGRMPGLLLGMAGVAIAAMVLLLSASKVSAESDSATNQRHEVISHMKASGCDIIDVSELPQTEVQQARHAMSINASITIDAQGEEKIFCKPGFNF